MIPINKPFLPPKQSYFEKIDNIWENYYLTNQGPLVLELEEKLKQRFSVNHLAVVSNGTMALQVSMKAMELVGEVITTPFSFIATTSSIVWEGCTPIFVDIEKTTLNIDASKIEEKITSNTCAILATHVYGNPCDFEEIEIIAKKYNLKIIYDAAHAFDVKYKGQSVFKYGDITGCSLHASKLYHCIEGGFVACSDEVLATKIRKSRNFGFETTESFNCLGVNAKNSEFHAAMGLCNYPYIEEIIDRRKLISDAYDFCIEKLNITKPVWNKNATKNYAYYPIIVESEQVLNALVAFLNQKGVATRRYFYPSLANSLPYIEPEFLEVTDDVSKRVLCLPLYYDLSDFEIKTVVESIELFFK